MGRTDLDFVLSIIEFLSLLITIMYVLSSFCLNFIQSICDILQFSLMQCVFQAAPFSVFLLVLFEFLLFFFKFAQSVFNGSEELKNLVSLSV